jgi:hypothetical protein
MLMNSVYDWCRCILNLFSFPLCMVFLQGNLIYLWRAFTRFRMRRGPQANFSEMEFFWFLLNERQIHLQYNAINAMLS